MAELDEITDLLQRNEVAVWEANRVARPEIELASDRLTYLNFFSLTLNTDQWFEKILSTDFYR